MVAGQGVKPIRFPSAQQYYTKKQPTTSVALLDRGKTALSAHIVLYGRDYSMLEA